MKIAFVRADPRASVFIRDERLGPELTEDALRWMAWSEKASSSSKNVIMELWRRGIVSECEEWKFWDRPSQFAMAPERVPLKLFQCDDDGTPVDLADYVASEGQPDILWVEGRHHPRHMEQVFAACPDSFKLVYSKDWKPWHVERIEAYDLCLVDEEYQVEKLTRRVAGVRAAVWDKLIDYEATHVPIDCEKTYDVCYVAYVRERKNHELLFRSMAQLADRGLTCVCVGGGGKERRAELARLAGELGLAVHFAGEVAKGEVNALINRSRIGVMCAEKDAAPRAILEYLAADVPVLVNAELRAGTRYVGRRAGLVRPPEAFAAGIAELLDNLDGYAPRAHLLEHYSRDKVIEKFIAILDAAGALASARA